MPVTPARAIEALEKHLRVVLQGQTLESVGWKQLDPLTLLIPLQAVREDGGTDDYYFRFGFAYYPEWPPSVRAVNPKTLRYDYPADVRWLPSVERCSEIGFHPQYNASVGQLICNSSTLEFYQVRHSCEPWHLWDAGRHTFALTLNVLRDCLRPPYYRGRRE